MCRIPHWNMICNENKILLKEFVEKCNVASEMKQVILLNDYNILGNNIMNFDDEDNGYRANWVYFDFMLEQHFVLNTVSKYRNMFYFL